MSAMDGLSVCAACSLQLTESQHCQNCKFDNSDGDRELRAMAHAAAILACENEKGIRGQSDLDVGRLSANLFTVLSVGGLPAQREIPLHDIRFTGSAAFTYDSATSGHVAITDAGFMVFSYHTIAGTGMNAIPDVFEVTFTLSGLVGQFSRGIVASLFDVLIAFPTGGWSIDDVVADITVAPMVVPVTEGDVPFVAAVMRATSLETNNEETNNEDLLLIPFVKGDSGMVVEMSGEKRLLMARSINEPWKGYTLSSRVIGALGKIMTEGSRIIAAGDLADMPPLHGEAIAETMRRVGVFTLSAALPLVELAFLVGRSVGTDGDALELISGFTRMGRTSLYHHWDSVREDWEDNIVLALGLYEAYGKMNAEHTDIAEAYQTAQLLKDCDLSNNAEVAVILETWLGVETSRLRDLDRALDDQVHDEVQAAVAEVNGDPRVAMSLTPELALAWDLLLLLEALRSPDSDDVTTFVNGFDDNLNAAKTCMKRNRPDYLKTVESVLDQIQTITAVIITLAGTTIARETGCWDARVIDPNTYRPIGLLVKAGNNNTMLVGGKQRCYIYSTMYVDYPNKRKYFDGDNILHHPYLCECSTTKKTSFGGVSHTCCRPSHLIAGTDCLNATQLTQNRELRNAMFAAFDVSARLELLAP